VQNQAGCCPACLIGIRKIIRHAISGNFSRVLLLSKGLLKSEYVAAFEKACDSA
jgi:hypothetical protein